MMLQNSASACTPAFLHAFNADAGVRTTPFAPWHGQHLLRS